MLKVCIYQPNKSRILNHFEFSTVSYGRALGPHSNFYLCFFLLLLLEISTLISKYRLNKVNISTLLSRHFDFIKSKFRGKIFFRVMKVEMST